jgi:hypothetical protein
MGRDFVQGGLRTYRCVNFSCLANSLCPFSVLSADELLAFPKVWEVHEVVSASSKMSFGSIACWICAPLHAQSGILQYHGAGPCND